MSVLPRCFVLFKAPSGVSFANRKHTTLKQQTTLQTPLSAWPWQPTNQPIHLSTVEGAGVRGGCESKGAKPPSPPPLSSSLPFGTLVMINRFWCEDTRSQVPAQLSQSSLQPEPFYRPKGINAHSNICWNSSASTAGFFPLLPSLHSYF